LIGSAGFCARHNAKPVHLGGSDRTDTVEFPDRQSLDEAWPHRGRDDELSVRFAMVGGKFGQELVVGYACRCRETGFIARMRDRISAAVAVAVAMPRRFAVTSRYASSSDSGSMSDV
jgi:hypothetical protein